MWKILSDSINCWLKVINFNYFHGGTSGSLFHIPPRNKSFFWACITPLLPSFRSCISKIVKNGANSLLWYDKWLDGRALKDIWPDLYNECTIPWTSVRNFITDLQAPESLFNLASLISLSPLLDVLPNYSSE